MNILHRNKIIFNFILAIFVLNIILVCQIFIPNEDLEDYEIYFFDVGQGDSSMIRVDDVKFLIDAGSGSKIINNLEKIGLDAPNYIDIVFISHPEVDHVGGLISLVEHYNIGLIVFNGYENELWSTIRNKLDMHNISYVALKSGDKASYKDIVFDVLWPLNIFNETKTNDSSLVLRVCRKSSCILYPGDIGGVAENKLSEIYDLQSYILKVPHHGSKYSSGFKFLNNVEPEISVIGVGNNSYGHPTDDVLNRLASLNSEIFRTDINGIIKIIFDENGGARIFEVE